MKTKRIFLALSIMLTVCVSINAQSSERTQNVTTKNGTNILPAAGDFAIGVSADPFLRYVGNLFTDAANGAPSFQPVEGTLIYGKYFLAPDRAIRAKVGLGFSTETTKNSVALNPPGSDLHATVDDVTKVKSTNIALSVGYELRRGYGRLQGFYGAEVGLAYAGEKTSREYGNALSASNTFRPNPIEETAGASFGFGVGGFAGVEYFVAPKISIGAEVGVNILLSSVPKSKITTETWDGSNARELTQEVYVNGSATSGFSTDPTGNLFVIFHF